MKTLDVQEESQGLYTLTLTGLTEGEAKHWEALITGYPYEVLVKEEGERQ